MATAAAAPPVVDVVVPKATGKKKLVIIIAAVLAVLLIGGGVALYMVKQSAAAAAAAEEGEDADAPAAKAEHAEEDEHKAPPVFVALDPFVVNLADRDAERFAQIGVTLQVDDPKFADELKLYLPAVRNGILMVLAHKTSQELLERSGKEQLAAEIMRESVRPMGIVIEVDTPGSDANASDKPKPKKKKPAVHNPIASVNFSSFIIQ